MTPEEYTRHDALGLAALIARGEISSAEAVETAIAITEALNPQLNAVIHTHFERALDEARGPLPPGRFRGVPFLLKDLGSGNRAGDPHHWGTRFLKDADYRAATTSTLVQRFDTAGFITVGRTNVPELGAWSITESDAYGPCRNPWNVDHAAGGSSGGAAAAVAAGLVPMAHASDGGGSIRNPASQCGLVGLKPTRGRLSLGPDTGEAWAGLVNELAVTRTVRDLAVLLDAVRGAAPGDPYVIAPPGRPYEAELEAEPGRLRIGVLSTLDVVEVHADCQAAATSAARLLTELGHTVENSYPAPLQQGAAAEFILQLIGVSQARDLERFGELLGRTLGADDVDSDNWAVAEFGRTVTATQYLAAIEALHRFQRQMAQWWTDYDLLLTPTITAPPPLIGSIRPDPANTMDAFMRSGNLLWFCSAFNATGQPAISLPLHWNDAGLPIGVQLVAAFGREDLLIRVARQLETAAPWAARVAPLRPGAA